MSEIVQGYLASFEVFAGRTDGLLLIHLEGMDESLAILGHHKEANLTLDSEPFQAAGLLKMLYTATARVHVTGHPIPDRYKTCLKAEFKTVPKE